MLSNVWTPLPHPLIKKSTSLNTFVSFQASILNQPFLKIGIFGQTPLKLNLETLLKGPSSQSTK